MVQRSHVFELSLIQFLDIVIFGIQQSKSSTTNNNEHHTTPNHFRVRFHHRGVEKQQSQQKNEQRMDLWVYKSKQDYTDYDQDLVCILEQSFHFFCKILGFENIEIRLLDLFIWFKSKHHSNQLCFKSFDRLGSIICI